MTRPQCKMCNRQLVKYTEYFGFGFREKMKTKEQAKAAVIDKYGPEAKVTHYAYHTGDMVLSVQVWRGRYGQRGDNQFCTIQCGYVWAVAQGEKR